MTQAPDVAHTLVMERALAHPVDKVWRAMTEPALLAEWMMQNDFRPVVGHKFTFRAEPKPHWDGVVPCEVLAVEPKTRLVFRWYDWTVALTLTPTATGTHLRMEQAAFGPDQGPAFAGAKYGWTGFLGNLEALLDRVPAA